ncbi:unnamed protein product, partial [Rotaria sp. Silwood1]
MTPITDHDKVVINAIFNPNYPLDFDSFLQLDTLVSAQNKKQALEIKRFEEEDKNEASLEDFKQAAELGSPFAKQQVLLTNP